MSSTLAAGVQRLGEELSWCPLQCDGIVNSHAEGIIPRCLALEDRIGDGGAVIVGPNPGRSTSAQKTALRNSEDNAYSKWRSIWEVASLHNDYYTRLRELLAALKITGPILWTELVKCEKEPKTTLPVQTLRTCAHRYLQREIALVPKEWPILAIGKGVFNDVSFIAAARGVVGVPHPTSSKGAFIKLFREGALHPTAAAQIKDARHAALATWLG